MATTTGPLPRAERRRSILAGAARAFAASGFEATSMEDIAGAAGVSKLILYRHFESKEELYRCTVERVSGRLGREVAAAVERGQRRGVFVRAFLTVAREDPDGFRLLWRQSAREPKFAGYSGEVRAGAVAFAGVLVGPWLRDESLRQWAAATLVATLVESVLNWLDHGDAASDDRFVELVTGALEAMIATWSS